MMLRVVSRIQIRRGRSASVFARVRASGRLRSRCHRTHYGIMLGPRLPRILALNVKQILNRLPAATYLPNVFDTYYLIPYDFANVQPYAPVLSLCSTTI